MSAAVQGLESELSSLEVRIAALESLEARVQRMRVVMALFDDLYERLRQAAGGQSPLFAVQDELEKAHEALRQDTLAAGQSASGAEPGLYAYAWRASAMVEAAAECSRKPELRVELTEMQGRLDEIADGL